MTVEVLNFGCRLNAYESQVMKNHAQNAGMQHTILVNSCAVTKEAERQTRQAIRRAKKQNPAAHIIVSGCSAQLDPQTYANMPEVAHVLGNEEKLQAEIYQNLSQWERARPRPDRGSKPRPAGGVSGEGFIPPEEKIQVNDIMSVTETAGHLIDGMDDHSRAFVQVQNGCNHRCTFCIIPYGRGNSRSVPMGDIVAQVRTLVERGYKEVVITGVDISDYGKDLPGQPSLGQMLRRLLKLVPELPRLRISSIDAIEMDESFFQLMAEEPRVMPHLHLSLQAGDDMVLKRMKRRHLRADIFAFIKQVRAVRSDVVFGADIIAGFPTETEAMFQNTYDLVQEADLTWLHIFPYSEREGTPAARMPQVEPAIRKARAARLRELGKQQEHNFLQSRIGKRAQVLVEKDGQGRCEYYAPVQVPKEIAAGQLIETEITAIANHQLVA
jgi:threonylcarbamoyladenosine tRNA methylthiotransferase MtaB